MPLLYFGVSTFFIPFRNLSHGPFEAFLSTFIVAVTYNFIRYRYFNTVRYGDDSIFLIYGCLDLFYVSYYFGVPALDQGGKVVIMFILIIAGIYRGRRIGIALTLFWFPIKMLSNSFFTHFIKDPGRPDFHNMMIGQNIIDAIYFQIVLLILVFITDVIYREIQNKEKESEAQNNKLKKVNADLEDANKKLAYRIGEFFTLQQVSQAIGSILNMDELMKFVNDITLGVMGVKGSTIILFNENNLKLEIQTTNVNDEIECIILSDNVNCKMLLSILESGTPVCDNNVDSNKYIFTRGRNVKSLICVPLIAKIRKFGLILIEQDFPNAFDDDKVRLLTIIGQQVGMAMENADEALYEAKNSGRNCVKIARQ